MPQMSIPSRFEPLQEAFENRWPTILIRVAERIDLPATDITFPTLVIAISSDGPIQQVCSQLRRANSYYIEGARLLMETRDSDAAEWWLKRQNERCSLPFVIGQFQAQLVSLTPTAVVAAAGLHGGETIKPLVAAPAGPAPARSSH